MIAAGHQAYFVGIRGLMHNLTRTHISLCCRKSDGFISIFYNLNILSNAFPLVLMVVRISDSLLVNNRRPGTRSKWCKILKKTAKIASWNIFSNHRPGREASKGHTILQKRSTKQIPISWIRYLILAKYWRKLPKLQAEIFSWKILRSPDSNTKLYIFYLS